MFEVFLYACLIYKHDWKTHVTRLVAVENDHAPKGEPLEKNLKISWDYTF
jgi:hypothetical protein